MQLTHLVHTFMFDGENKMAKVENDTSRENNSIRLSKLEHVLNICFTGKYFCETFFSFYVTVKMTGSK